MDVKNNGNRNKDIANVAKHLLEKHGICSFGVLLTEDDKELGYCYLKDGSFMFVNGGGEETRRPLMDKTGKWFYDLGISGYMHPIKLLQYNEYDMTYRICNPSCEEYCSIYNQEGGNKFYIICSDDKCIPIDLRNGYFEYIDCPLFFILSFHDYDEPMDKEIQDNRYESYYFPQDVFYNMKTNEIFNNVSIVNYKTNKIVSGVAPYCTLVFDDNMIEVYRKEESAVFCVIGQFAFLIFEKSSIAYNIDKQIEKELENLEEYDNYDVGLNFLVKYRVTSCSGDSLLHEDETGEQYWEHISKYVTTSIFVYNSNLDIVRELFVPGVFKAIVQRNGKIMIWCSIEGEHPSNQYYDINRQDSRQYDKNTHKMYSIADITDNEV